MKYFIGCFLFFVSLNTKAQTCGDLNYHGILPSPASDTAEAFLNLQVYCNEMIHLDHADVNVIGNNITVDAYYCWGWLMVITTTNDSISLGLLPAGNYTYSVNIWTSYEPTFDCLSFVSATSATGNFNVEHIIDESSIDENDLSGVWYNATNKTLHMSADKFYQTISLLSLDGKIVFTQPNPDAVTVLPENITPGIYILQLTSESRILSGKIYISE